MGVMNTKAVYTGTQGYVWGAFDMPVLTANGTIDNTDHTYACAFKGSGGSTSNNIYNAFNDNTANYFGFTATSSDTRVLVFYTPYKLKVNSISFSAAVNKDTSGNQFIFNYYPKQTTLPSSLNDLITTNAYHRVISSITTGISNSSLSTSTYSQYSNYHCFVFTASDTNGNYIQARLYRVVLSGKYQASYVPSSATADFTKPIYSVVKDGNIYKAIL